MHGDVSQDGEREPDPVEADDAAGRDQHIHQRRPRQEDKAQQRPDERVESKLPADRVEEPPHQDGRTGAE